MSPSVESLQSLLLLQGKHWALSSGLEGSSWSALVCLLSLPSLHGCARSQALNFSPLHLSCLFVFLWALPFVWESQSPFLHLKNTYLSFKTLLSEILSPVTLLWLPWDMTGLVPASVITHLTLWCSDLFACSSPPPFASCVHPQCLTYLLLTCAL